MLILSLLPVGTDLAPVPFFLFGPELPAFLCSEPA